MRVYTMDDVSNFYDETGKELTGQSIEYYEFNSEGEEKLVRTFGWKIKGSKIVFDFKTNGYLDDVDVSPSNLDTFIWATNIALEMLVDHVNSLFPSVDDKVAIRKEIDAIMNHVVHLEGAENREEFLMCKFFGLSDALLEEIQRGKRKKMDREEEHKIVSQGL